MAKMVRNRVGRDRRSDHPDTATRTPSGRCREVPRRVAVRHRRRGQGQAPHRACARRSRGRAAASSAGAAWAVTADDEDCSQRAPESPPTAKECVRTRPRSRPRKPPLVRRAVNGHTATPAVETAGPVRVSGEPEPIDQAHRGQAPQKRERERPGSAELDAMREDAGVRTGRQTRRSGSAEGWDEGLQSRP